jgi:RHS repeat-associated protein
MKYLYDGMNIIKEYDGTGTLLATYTQGPGMDQPIAMTRGGQTVYYHADGLGSVVGLTNSSQTVVQNYGYDGFGNLTQAPTVQNPYTYTGREWDPETGLYYYRARYYDPKAGRFLQQDPIGMAGGINLYAYVGNNPVNFVDPNGWLTIAISGGYQGVPLAGGTQNSSGYYWSPDGSGWFNTYGNNNSGLSADAGVTLGVYKGCESDFMGPYINWNLGTPWASLNVYWDANGNFMGIGVGVGPSIGFSRTITNTTKLR